MSLRTNDNKPKSTCTIVGTSKMLTETYELLESGRCRLLEAVVSDGQIVTVVLDLEGQHMHVPLSTLQQLLESTEIEGLIYDENTNSVGISNTMILRDHNKHGSPTMGVFSALEREGNSVLVGVYVSVTECEIFDISIPALNVLGLRVATVDGVKDIGLDEVGGDYINQNISEFKYVNGQLKINDYTLEYLLRDYLTVNEEQGGQYCEVIKPEDIAWYK